MLKDRTIIGIALIIISFLFLNNDTGATAAGSTVSLNGTEVTSPNFVDSDDIAFTATDSDIEANLKANSVDSTEIAADAVGTSELDLTGTTPEVGDCVLVASTTSASFESDTCPGGGADTFKTISAPAGANPIADNSTDTLTLTSSDSTLVITGADDPESIDFTAGAEMLTESELDTEAELEAQLTDVTNVYTDNDPSITTLTGPLSSPTHLTFTPTTAPAHTEGRIYYDSDADTLVVFNAESDVALNVGEESFVFVRNQTGSTITDGQAVYVSGQSGNTPLISLAQADATSTARAIGIATHDIEHNTNGYVTTFGIVRGLDTTAFSVGDVLFLSDSVAGGFTTTKPEIAVFMGNVLVSHATQGRILSSTRAPITPIALGSDTTGDYVQGIIEGTAIDVTGSGGESSTPTVNFDSTEINTTTWGDGTSDFIWTFNPSGSGNPTFTLGNGGFTVTTGVVTTFTGPIVQLLAPSGSTPEFRLRENFLNGTNYIAVKPPSNIIANRTCTLEDDATPYDPCIATTTYTALEKSIIITAATTTLTNLAQIEFKTAITLTKVRCSTNTGTVTIQLDERVGSTPNTAGTDVMTSNLVCDTDSQETAAFDNAAIAAESPLNLQIISTTGTDPSVRIHIFGTRGS